MRYWHFFFLFSLGNIPAIGLCNVYKADTTDVAFEQLLIQAQELKTSNQQQALQLAEKAMIMARKKSSIDFELRVYSLLGDIEISNSNYSKALQHLEHGLQDVGRAEDLSLVAKLHNQLAVAHHYQSRFDLSLEHYLNALTIYERLNHSLDMSKLYGNIGIVYYMMRDLDAAEEYYRKAIVLQEKLGEQHMLIKNYINLGGIYHEHRKLDSALYNYTRAITLADAIGEEKTKGPVLHNIGLLYADRHDYALAEKFMNDGLAIHRKYNDKHLIAQSEIEIADFYKDRQLYQRAESEYRQAVADAKESESLNLEARAYKSLYELYKLQNRNAEALLYTEKYHQLKDSIFSKEKNATIQELRLRYETEKKEKEIEALSSRAQTQRKLTLLSVLAAILGFSLLIISVVTYRLRSQNLLQKAALLEEEKNKAISEKTMARQEEQKAKEGNQQLTVDIEHKKRELASSVLLINQKNEVLLSIKKQLDSFTEGKESVAVKSLRDISKEISSSLNQEENWELLKVHFESVHPSFFSKLMDLCPDLTPAELRHCAYLKMNIATKDVANMLGVNAETVRMSRYRIKKKLNLSADEDLHPFILKLN